MSPVFGLLVDKLGKNIIWVLCAVITTLASHIMLAFTFWNPWIAMVTNSLRLTAKYAKIRNGVDAELVCVSCHCLLTV